jgi:hypothetical protein
MPVNAITASAWNRSIVFSQYRGGRAGRWHYQMFLRPRAVDSKRQSRPLNNMPSPRLRLEKFAINGAKTFLQQNLAKPDSCGAA